MVTALRPIEVRTAAADEVPKVAAVLADAFINDPVFTFLRPGRLRQEARLRTMFAVEMRAVRAGERGDRVDDVRVRRRGGRAATRRLGDAEVRDGEGDTQVDVGVQDAIAARDTECSARWRSDTYVSLTSTSERSGCAPLCRDRAWDRCSCSRRWREPIRLGYRRTSRPAASVARHCTSGSASCTWVCLNCQKAARRFGRCVGLRQGPMSVLTVEEIRVGDIPEHWPLARAVVLDHSGRHVLGARQRRALPVARSSVDQRPLAK